MFRWGEKSWSHHRCSFACPVTESQSLFCGYLLLISPCGIRDPFKNQTDYFIALATAPEAFGQPWHNWYLSGKSRRKNAAIKVGLLSKWKVPQFTGIPKGRKSDIYSIWQWKSLNLWMFKIKLALKAKASWGKRADGQLSDYLSSSSSCDSSQKNRENAILNWKVQTKS